MFKKHTDYQMHKLSSTSIICGEVVHNISPEMEYQLFMIQNLPVTYNCPEEEIC